MSKQKKILLLCGGGGTEHEVSLVSCQYLEKCLSQIPHFETLKVVMEKDGRWVTSSGEECFLGKDRHLQIKNGQISIDYAVPCIHGPPGETGDIQSYFELIGLPYMGTGPEGSKLCFNKVSTKLWLSYLNIPTTPFYFISSMDELEIAQKAFDQWKYLFVKASSQGSSVGVYLVTDKKNLEYTLIEAFRYSPYVLLEKRIVGRELEVAVYEHQGKVIATVPGEIICPNKFYSYSEKYDPNSKTTTNVIAPNLPAPVVEKMQQYSIKAFQALKLRHLSRVDYFYSEQGEVLLSEINTFPGMTPISMFPKMMENRGQSFAEFLRQTIEQSLL